MSSLRAKTDTHHAGWLDPIREAVGLRSVAWVLCESGGQTYTLAAVSTEPDIRCLTPGETLLSAGPALAALRSGQPMMMNHDCARSMNVPYSRVSIPVWGAMICPGTDGFLWGDRDRDIVDDNDLRLFSAFGRQFLSVPPVVEPVGAPMDCSHLLDTIEATGSILRSENEMECFRKLADAAMQLSKSRLAVVAAVHPQDESYCRVVATSGAVPADLLDSAVPLHGSLVGLVIRSQMAAPSDFKCGPGNRRALGPDSPLGLELDEGLVVLPAGTGNATPAAVLLAGGDYTDASSLHGTRTLCSCAGLLAHQFRLRDRIEHDAMRDGLTGLLNRRAFNEMYAQVFRSTWRQGLPISMLMIDADHFKKVNDEMGHPAGDIVLGFIASTIESCLRESDFVARYGGEEFVVCLPGTEGRGAIKVAERIRQVCSNTVIPLERGGRVVTVSIGVSTIAPSHKATPAADVELLKQADDALYRAKSRGRNRIECI